MPDQNTLYYRLTPIHPRPPGAIANASIVTCMATGKQLHHCGGGGLALAPDIVAALDARNHGGKARMIVDQQDWDDLRGFLAVVIEAFEDKDLLGASIAGDGVKDMAQQLRARTEDPK